MLEKSFNPTEAEARIYKMWEDSGAFKPRAAKPTDTKDDNYSIVIPPPNVTGSLHMGHALNNTIMDILIRFNRMKGKAVLWQPGMDHAGIATQMVVERKLAAEQKYRKNMTREQFLNHVWAWKAESGGMIEQQLRRLGSSCDWSRSKFTLGDREGGQMADAVTKAFVDMYNDGLIYRDKRLVNWDPHFQTAISDLEVETKTVDGHYWHLRYPLADGVTYEHPVTDEDGNVTGYETRDYVVVATSRPETMLGDTGVAVHPEDERYAPLVGKEVVLPVVGRRIPIVADDYADPEKGSGAVKITPAHDFNDYEVGKRAGHTPISILDTRGHILPLESIPSEFHDLFTVKARKLVVAKFEEAGLLAETENLKIEQPVGDRSGVVIEPMLTDQWFVDAEKLAGEAVQAVERGHEFSPPRAFSQNAGGGDARTEGTGRGGESTKDASDNLTPPSPASFQDAKDTSPERGGNPQGSTRFIPENWKKTYDHWMENIQPWCISRQLWWGHQIPAWYFPHLDDYGRPRSDDANIWVYEDENKAEEELRFCIPSMTNPVIDGKNDRIFFDNETFLEAIKSYELETGSKPLLEDDGLGRTFKTYYPNGDQEKAVSFIRVDRDPDVLDTWFSSGLWPFSTLGWPEKTEELERFYPTSTLVTGFDIIFFWVARMMMQGLQFMDEVPFDDVYIHALVLDEAGKKMSKSIGNTLDPLDLIDGVSIDTLIEKRTRGLKNPDKAPKVAKATRKAYPDGFEAYGADALRFTLASQAGQGRNVRLSVDRIAGYRNFGTKLWSAASFGQMNGCKPAADFDPSSAALPVNKWIISETAKTAMEISRCIEAYRFNDAADAVYKFTWDTFCAWYLELSKPLLSGEDGAEKEETRATFAWALDQILKLLHPFMPFITEDLWAKIAEGRDSNLITADWPTYGEELVDADAVAELDWLQTLITNIRSVRADMNIPPAKKAPLLLCGDTLDPRLATYAPQLSPMARVDAVELAAAVPDNALQTVVDGVQYAIPLAGLIDMDAERKRLAKEIEKAQSEIEKIDKKLSNEAFVAKAPEKVVTLQKERRAGYSAEVETLQAALDGLG